MFLDAADYPFLSPLRERWQEIRAEFFAVSARSRVWPGTQIHNGKWRVIPLRYYGQVLIPDAPVALAAGDTPLMRDLSFSLLEPGAEITTHTDDNNTVRGHLCLTSNPDSAIKVGDVVRPYVEGDLFVFDERSPHSAWNRGKTERATLMFGFDRDPERGPTPMTPETIAAFFKRWWT